MRKAVYPGSFDPMSNGHLDIIKRASKMFDEVHVLISNNIFKKSTFTVEERVNMVKKCIPAKYDNIIVTSYDGLVVQYAKENKINVIVRGMRNYSDYEAEFQLFQYNKDIYPDCETILLMPSTKNQIVSSSAVKELVTFGCDIKKYVPAEIASEIIEKISQK